MKKLPLLACCLLATAFVAGPAQARDDLLQFDINGAMNTPDAQQKADQNLRMFWVTRSTPSR